MCPDSALGKHRGPSITFRRFWKKARKAGSLHWTSRQEHCQSSAVFPPPPLPAPSPAEPYQRCLTVLHHDNWPSPSSGDSFRLREGFYPTPIRSSWRALLLRIGGEFDQGSFLSDIAIITSFHTCQLRRRVPLLRHIFAPAIRELELN